MAIWRVRLSSSAGVIDSMPSYQPLSRDAFGRTAALRNQRSHDSHAKTASPRDVPTYEPRPPQEGQFSTVPDNAGGQNTRTLEVVGCLGQHLDWCHPWIGRTRLTIDASSTCPMQTRGRRQAAYIRTSNHHTVGSRSDSASSGCIASCCTS